MPMPAPAPAWPTRPLRFVVGYPAGGLTDIIARAYGGAIAEALQQTVTVENHAGAGGMQAGGVVAKAAPDGHTWWVTISAPLNQNRVYFRKLPYDPDRDFAYAAAVPVGQVVLAVPGDSKVRSLPELAEVARRERITMGNFGVGTWPHMATHQLALRHRWQVDGVPYKGEAPMWQDLVGGRVDSAVGSIFGLTPFMELGRARPIAVQTRQRSRLLPDVPTFVEHGYTDPVFELQGWIGVFAPSGTPKDIVQRLSDLVQQAASSPRVRQLHDRFALDAPWPAAEFERRNREDLPHWLALARALRIEPE
jgi:tripartite-type tricarboxylate transporter receptor subunit TctC